LQKQQNTIRMQLSVGEITHPPQLPPAETGAKVSI
jgi:hypothetical protein